MATIQQERLVSVNADTAWDALRDWAHVHERLVPGFVTDTEIEDGDRIVTFFSGTVVRERLVSSVDEDRRLVWTVVGGRFDHYNGAAQVVPVGDAEIRFVWTVDLLPDEHAELVGQLVERGIETVKRTLEAG